MSPGESQLIKIAISRFVPRSSKRLRACTNASSRVANGVAGGSLFWNAATMIFPTSLAIHLTALVNASRVCLAAHCATQGMEFMADTVPWVWLASDDVHGNAAP